MQEFIDFLGAQTPYDLLDSDDLDKLARTVEVEFFGSGDIIVPENVPALEHLYIVRTGAVEVLDRGRTVDVLTSGDTFGHVSVLSGLPPALVVRAAEDTLCYRIPDPRTVVAHPDRLRYAHYGTVTARERLLASGGSFNRLERSIVDLTHPITWCHASDSIREVAQTMTRTGQSCTNFVHDGQIGIVTDDDFRKRVATGEIPVNAPISAIASIPAMAISSDVTVSTAYLHMVEHGIHHLVVTDTAGAAVGIARVVDIAATDVRHPLLIRSATSSARSFDELAQATTMLRPTAVELWDAGVPPFHLGALYSTMVEAVFRKLVELCSTTAPLSGIHSSWMLLGSLGRREPLLNSDVDTALVWNPIRGNGCSQPRREDVAAACHPLLNRLNQFGLMPCPEGLNASSPLFNRTVAAWQQAAVFWREELDNSKYLMLSSTLLDARPITNTALAQPVRAAFAAGTDNHSFARTFTHYSLGSRPPSGFARNFVIGRFGELKGHLNLKKAGLRPVVSLARALALRTGDTTGSTVDRLDRAHDAGLLDLDEAESLKGAFTLCYDLVLGEQIHAIKNDHAISSTVDVDKLDSLQRRHLRAAFRSINQVQERISSDRYDQ
ncbi:putative nucleotidyltransferase substrate binding domain-containing protein [Rhodococcus sp. NPDC056960]|uniref:putative nucleotidyltransferase substrate binding domain-containing protein n=1 Tax=Rhodococcus sp. NPDC056960 TaxID=3345982 RepID=UPI003637B1EA